MRIIGRMRHRGRRIAALSLVAAIAVVAGLAVASKDLVLERWLAWRLESTDFAVRERAARLLAARGSLYALDFALESLEKELDDSLDYGFEAEGPEPPPDEGSSWLGDYWQRMGERAVPALLRAWDEAADDRRGTIALAFRELGNPALETLVAALGDPRPRLRRRAAEALVCFGAQGEGSFEALRRRMDDVDIDVRVAVLRTLAIVAPREAETSIVERAERDPIVSVRLAAASLVRELGYGKDAVESAVGALDRLLADPDPGTREAAARHLCKFGPAASSVAPTLERIARSDSEATVREAAAEALQSIR